MSLETSMKELSRRISRLENRQSSNNEMRQAIILAIGSADNTMQLQVETSDGGVLENVGVVGEWTPAIGKSTWIIKFDRLKWIAIGQTKQSGVLVSSGWFSNWANAWPTEGFE